MDGSIHIDIGISEMSNSGRWLFLHPGYAPMWYTFTTYFIGGNFMWSCIVFADVGCMLCLIKKLYFHFSSQCQGQVTFSYCCLLVWSNRRHISSIFQVWWITSAYPGQRLYLKSVLFRFSEVTTVFSLDLIRRRKRKQGIWGFVRFWLRVR